MRRLDERLPACRWKLPCFPGCARLRTETMRRWAQEGGSSQPLGPAQCLCEISGAPQFAMLPAIRRSCASSAIRRHTDVAATKIAEKSKAGPHDQGFTGPCLPGGKAFHSSLGCLCSNLRQPPVLRSGARNKYLGADTRRRPGPPAYRAAPDSKRAFQSGARKFPNTIPSTAGPQRSIVEPDHPSLHS